MTRSRKKKRTNYKLPLALDLLNRIAPKLIHPGMMALVGEGYQLRPSSGIWRKLDGTLTARFVYRDAGADRDSLVLSVRNIRVELLETAG